MKTQLSENLKSYRMKTGMTIAQVAEFMSVTPDTIIDWEEGEKEPTKEQLKMLASLYGLKDEKELYAKPGGKKYSVYFYSDEEREEMRRKAKLWHKFPYPMICVIVFLILGVLEPHLWHPGWLVFLTIPIYYGAVDAIAYKRGNRFPYPVLALLIYLCIGIFANVWTWSLLIFLTVPLYYWLVNGSWKNIWTQFPYALLCVVVYLILGFALNWWHPGWIIFLTIPIFNSIVAMFRNK